MLLQQKGQETVEWGLRESFANAVRAYYDNNGCYPEHLIYFRDGVGAGMRRKILNFEVKMFEQVFKEDLNKCTLTPKITVVVVNKRINHRFFVQEGHRLNNVPSGTIIDTDIVYKPAEREIRGDLTEE